MKDSLMPVPTLLLMAGFAGSQKSSFVSRLASLQQEKRVIGRKIEDIVSQASFNNKTWIDSIIDKCFLEDKYKKYHLVIIGNIASIEEISGPSQILAELKRARRHLNDLIHQIIKLLFISEYIHNKTSRSPTPTKREPPIGGIKVGGKQHVSRHAV